MFVFFFQAEDGIRDAQESRGLGDVYKRQPHIPSIIFQQKKNTWSSATIRAYTTIKKNMKDLLKKLNHLSGTIRLSLIHI